MKIALKKSGFTPPLYTGAGFSLIELLVVAGIFSLIIGVTFTLLTAGRFSVNLTEAQILAQDHARAAMDRITRELRLSQAGLVFISNNILWAQSSTLGSVVNFQIPVGSYADKLDLESDGSLKWGTEDNEGAYLAYSLNENLQLLRSTFTNTDGSDATGRIVSPHISALTFSRPTTSSNLITITIVGQTQTARGRVVTQTLTSSLKLRN